MPIGKFNLFNDQNMQRFMPNLGAGPFPMRGLERFMQKRGMNFSDMFKVGPQQIPTPGGAENFSNTLKVQEQQPKAGGIKGFLSQFSSKFK